MRRLLPLLLVALLFLSACKTKKLAQRLPGTWYIDHYDEYTADSSTGHNLDGAGYMSFSRKGTAGRRLISGRLHGSLEAFGNGRWRLQDSFLVITDAGGTVQEEWLITKDLTDYMEWVSVNSNHDRVRTMYLKK